ncbi:MAG: helix-turn-helix domain-containing protein [Anaerolineae bacterium]
MPIQVGSVMLYSATDIAHIVDMHPSTVRKRLREGDLNGRKIAGKWYVTAGDLVGYLAGEGHDTDLPEMPLDPSPVEVFPELGAALARELEPDEPPTDELSALRARASVLLDRARRLEAIYLAEESDED